jgi:hypothetical protein
MGDFHFENSGRGERKEQNTRRVSENRADHAALRRERPLAQLSDFQEPVRVVGRGRLNNWQLSIPL